MIDFELLKKLCLCNGISGDEQCVRSIIEEQIKNYADSMYVDNLGNLIVHKKGRERAKKKVMLSAHMDEVGFLVTDITSDGYVKFDEVGGIDRRVVIGKRVTIGKNQIVGTVGIKPIHLSKGDESSLVPKFSDMYIDIGADSRETALNSVSIGDCINFVSDFKMTDTVIMSKALDDRFGCLVLIDIIKSDLQYDTDFAFVVQEEVGLRGAKTAAFALNPEIAFVIETTTAADIPEVDEEKQVCNLGSGAVISVMDKRTIYDKKLVAAAFDCAKSSKINVQYKRAVAGGNDAGAIHQSRCGVRTLAISLPCRYLHSQNCAANKNDCESVIKLSAEMAEMASSGNLG